jgi:hypothetical protein
VDRGNHYEAAFEAFLQAHRLPYVAVDETRRAQLGDASMKSLDFIVHAAGGVRLLVDVKGRRFPGKANRRVWESWSTREDVAGLERWGDLFGPGYRGLLVFAYHLSPAVRLAAATEDVWGWRGGRYLLRAVAVEGYRQAMRVRSPRWDTVDVPRPAFKALVRPFSRFLEAAPAAAASCPF